MNFWTPRLVKSWLISPIQSLLYVLRHDNWKELHNFRNVIDCCKCQNIQIDFGFPAMKKLHRLLEWRKLSQLLELSPLFVSKYNRLHLFLCRFCIGQWKDVAMLLKSAAREDLLSYPKNCVNFIRKNNSKVWHINIEIFWISVAT